MFYAFLLISLFSIPGFLLILKFPYYLTSSGYNFKYFNTFLISSSIFLFFILPFLKLSNIQNFKESLLSKIILAFLITALSAIFFDYNPKNGGGILMKISNIFLGGNLFFFTSFAGFFIISTLVKENKYSLYLIIIVFILFSNNYMYQKYFEPLWFILFFLVINSKNIFGLFKKQQTNIPSFRLFCSILCFSFN